MAMCFLTANFSSGVRALNVNYRRALSHEDWREIIAEAMRRKRRRPAPSGNAKSAAGEERAQQRRRLGVLREYFSAARGLGRRHASIYESFGKWAALFACLSLLM